MTRLSDAAPAPASPSVSRGATTPVATAKDSSGSRRAAWRIALRMARRDIRRHKGRSSLIVILVGLPVLLLVTGATLVFTQQVNNAEIIPYAMGSTDAVVIHGLNGQSFQAVVPDVGAVAPEGPQPNLQKVPGLTGATMIPFANVTGSTSAAPGQPLEGLMVDAATNERYLTGKAALISGRWPASPNEIVVTPLGLQAGLPSSGTLPFNVSVPFAQGPPSVSPVRVVGVADAYLYSFERPSAAHFVIAPQPSVHPNTWLAVAGHNGGFSWSDVKQLNAAGYGVLSRAVLTDPPSDAELAAYTGWDQSVVNNQRTVLLALMAMAVLGLFLETTLLAGPAFAVSAARQRHSLALLASNGATRGQLGKTVLGQALLLGAIAGVAGAVLGLGAAAALRGLLHSRDASTLFAPLDISYAATLGTLACAVFASIVAALLPARGLGKLDIVSVLRAQSATTTPTRRMPVAGLVVMLVGITLCFVGGDASRGMAAVLMLGLGALLVVLGAALVVPWVLIMVGRLVRPLPLPLRMAGRDAARERTRAVPTILAILAGTAALTTLSISAATEAARVSAVYLAEEPNGTGSVRLAIGAQAQGSPSNTATLGQIEVMKSLVHQADPALNTAGLLTVSPSAGGNVEGDRLTASPMAYLRPPGCTDAQVLDLTQGAAACPAIGVGAAGSNGGIYDAIRAMPAEDLIQRFGLDADQAEVIRAGGFLVIDPPAPESIELASKLQGRVTPQPASPLTAAGDSVQLVSGQARDLNGATASGPKYSFVGSPHTEVVPAVHLSRAQAARVLEGHTLQAAGAIVSTERATKEGWQLGEPILLVSAPSGSLSPTASDRVAAKLAAASQASPTGPQYSLNVSTPPAQDDGLIITIMFSVLGLLILLASLIATALALTEQQAMLGTLAAVGATRWTRKSLAAAQAGMLAFIGAALGVVIGLAPGLALGRLVTGMNGEGRFLTVDHIITGQPYVVVPWLHFLGPVVLVPLIAGAVAWLGVRRAPMVTRRAT